MFLRRLPLSVVSCLLGIVICCDRASEAGHIGTELVTTASAPMFVTHAPGFDDYLFVTERGGRVRTFDLRTNEYFDEPLLNISDEVYTGGEAGMLGMAFHPQFATNGRVFVHFSGDHLGEGQHTSFLRSYKVADLSTDGPLVVDMETESTVLTIGQPNRQHNGGWIGFSPNDPYLYIATGDGGDANDVGPGHTPVVGNAQDITNNLLGKILRIDVDDDAFPDDDQRNYAVPESNPFVGLIGDDEIWAYGLRNPWRSSFDRETGDLWIADVGQGKREEINFQAADSEGAANYGWRVREGLLNRATGEVDGTKPARNVDPIHDYAHVAAPDGGYAVVGGYVYRGPVAELYGDYFFADFVTNQIWSLRHDGTVTSDVANRTGDFAPDSGELRNIVSFGEDALGNLYLLRRTGAIYRVTAADIVEQILGDYNLNGLIDLPDYNVWRDTFGQQGDGLAADGNGDGQVGLADYILWRDEYVFEEANAEVPEPTAAVAALIGVAVLTWGTRRRGRQR